MDVRRLSLITTQLVKEGLDDGGHIKYVREESGKKTYWRVLYWDKTGQVFRVVSPGRLIDRTFPTADALINFHMRHFPDIQEFVVPLAIDKFSQRYPPES